MRLLPGPLRDSLAAVEPTPAEVATALPGDDLVPGADVVMDRAFTLDAPPAEVWPWLVQLGKGRAGWYLPRSVERVVPVARRATRRVEARWQGLAVGDVVPDYGGPHETFEVVALEPARVLALVSRRGRQRRTAVSWVHVLSEPRPGVTRVHLRLRIGPVKRVGIAGSLGGAFDEVTIAGMAAGLAERLAEARPPRGLS